MQQVPASDLSPQPQCFVRIVWHCRFSVCIQPKTLQGLALACRKFNSGAASPFWRSTPEISRFGNRLVLLGCIHEPGIWLNRELS